MHAIIMGELSKFAFCCSYRYRNKEEPVLQRLKCLYIRRLSASEVNAMRNSLPCSRLHGAVAGAIHRALTGEL